LSKRNVEAVAKIYAFTMESESEYFLVIAELRIDFAADSIFAN